MTLKNCFLQVSSEIVEYCWPIMDVHYRQTQDYLNKVI